MRLKPPGGLMPRSPLSQVTSGARFIGGVFGLIFFGIGLTVLIFLWSAPFGEFGSPPLFFRVFGSFIAIAFLAGGGTVAFGAIFGGGMMSEITTLAEKQSTLPPAQAGYVCSNCGAALGEKAEVSPLGDVKCPFCGTWFNIHRKG